MSTSIFLIRHGESEWNAARRLQGQHPSAPGLTEKGREQVRALKDSLEIRPDSVYSSPAKRAVQTAEILFPRVEIKINSNLQERAYGEIEGMKKEELVIKHPQAAKAYKETRELPGIKGAESHAEVEKRALKALTKLAKENAGKTIVCVSHGDFIMAFLKSVLGWSTQRLAAIKTTKASVSEAVYDNGRFKILKEPEYLERLE